jgi:hypothetical protein
MFRDILDKGNLLKFLLSGVIVNNALLVDFCIRCILPYTIHFTETFYGAIFGHATNDRPLARNTRIWMSTGLLLFVEASIFGDSVFLDMSVSHSESRREIIVHKKGTVCLQ